MLKLRLLCLVVCSIATATLAFSQVDLPTVPGIALQEIKLKSSLDGKEQPVIIGVPEGLDPAQPVPLLVGIHTWSSTYTLYAKAFAPTCAARKWLLVLPNFRGPNTTSNPAPKEAGGSIFAQHDIMDAVRYMQEQYKVDPARIYLIGASGGGHMSLLMATKYPDVWAGVSAWCPITSLADWHAQGTGYTPHIEAVTGGKPGSSPEVDFEYARRCSRAFITNAANTNVFIGHGDHDPIINTSQNWKTFELLRPLAHRVEFYSWSGGHEMQTTRALEWLASKTRPSDPPLKQSLVTDEGKWYFWCYLEPAAPLTFATCDATVTKAQAAEGDKPAQPAALTLVAESCKVLRVKLNEVGLGAVKSATFDGQPLAAEAYTISDGVLELKPSAQKSSYRFEF